MISPCQGVLSPVIVKGARLLTVQWFRVIILVDSLLKKISLLRLKLHSAGGFRRGISGKLKNFITKLRHLNIF